VVVVEPDGVGLSAAHAWSAARYTVLVRSIVVGGEAGVDVVELPVDPPRAPRPNPPLGRVTPWSCMQLR
jgi:hypothetical protein